MLLNFLNKTNINTLMYIYIKYILNKTEIIILITFDFGYNGDKVQRKFHNKVL